MDVFPTSLDCDPITNKAFQVQTTKKIYYSLVNIVMFFIPILLMSICYSMIVAKLYCTASPGERVGGVSPQARAKRKVVKLVLVVIATFVICWSPHQVPMAHAIFSQTHRVNETGTPCRPENSWMQGRHASETKSRKMRNHYRL